MLPPHQPNKVKTRGPRQAVRTQSVARAGMTPLGRMALGNIRARLRKAPAALRKDLRILATVSE